MKLLASLKPRFKKLDSRGITHVVAPLVVLLLVAVTGTYVAVSKQADNKDLSNATTAAAKSTAKTKTGALVIYSQKGRFDSVKIQIVAADVKTHKCGGAFSDSKDYVTRKLPAKAPLKISCSAVSGNGQYALYFGKHGKFPSNYVGVNVDGGYCTFVHKDPDSTRLAAIVKGKCTGASSENDSPKKLATGMRVLPKLGTNKKTITGYVEVNSPNEDLTRVQCAGQVSVNTGANVYNLALKYARVKSGNSYCVAKINLGGASVTPGTYTLKASFPGNDYLNPVSGTATTAVTIPKS